MQLLPCTSSIQGTGGHQHELTSIQTPVVPSAASPPHPTRPPWPLFTTPPTYLPTHHRHHRHHHHHHPPPPNMPALTATYASPTSSSHTFASELPTLSSPPSTADRVAYLAELASALKNMQKDVNEFLTQKMADDKAADDAKDEETYGEEIVDDD
jgi:hypothetical protein